MENNCTIYLETGSTDPYYNLAFEEYVLLNKKQGDILILWQNDNTIVIGQNQNTEAEINKKAVRDKKINVVRRTTGGGAVYHDLGNINYSFITDVGRQEDISFEKFTQPVVSALNELGLNASASGRNDIVVDGKKVSGTAQRISGGRILHHGTLLFDSNPSLVAEALNADPHKFRDKASKSVHSRIGNIRDFLKEDMEIQQFWDYLKETLSKGEFVKSELIDVDIDKIKELRSNKYVTWDWNFGKTREYSMRNKVYLPGGILEACVEVEKGIVIDIDFLGDFMAVRSLDDVRNKLTGIVFKRDVFADALDSLALEEYFGSINKDEILTALFRD